MKKLLPVVALLFLFAACKGKKDEKKPDDAATTTTTTTTDQGTTTTTTTTTENTTPAGDVPKFSDATVQKYVDDYTAFVKGYVEAYKTKDMTKITELSTKASEWAGKTVEMSKKLVANPDEATKFSTYMAKLSQDMTAAMTAK